MVISTICNDVKCLSIYCNHVVYFQTSGVGFRNASFAVSSGSSWQQKNPGWHERLTGYFLTFTKLPASFRWERKNSNFYHFQHLSIKYEIKKKILSISHPLYRQQEIFCREHSSQKELKIIFLDWMSTQSRILFPGWLAVFFIFYEHQLFVYQIYCKYSLLSHVPLPFCLW